MTHISLYVNPHATPHDPITPQQAAKKPWSSEAPDTWLMLIPIIRIANKNNAEAPIIHFQACCFFMYLTVSNSIKLTSMHPNSDATHMEE